MRTFRKDEQPRSWFRSDRLFSVDGYWYFSTREGVDIGPYDTQCEAQIEAGFLRELLLGAQQSPPEETLRGFLMDAYLLGRPIAPEFGAASRLSQGPRAGINLA